MLSAWASFVLYVFIGCSFVMGLRWVRRRLMWRLRNRLIVTYVFIGVIPIILLVAMALLAGYLFAGQFATYVASADLQSELQHLESANTALAVAVPQSGQNRQLDGAACRRNRQRLGGKFSPSHRDHMGGRAWLRCSSRPPRRRSPTNPALHRNQGRLQRYCARRQAPASPRGEAVRRRHASPDCHLQCAHHCGAAAQRRFAIGVGRHPSAGRATTARHPRSSLRLPPRDAIFDGCSSASLLRGT